MTALPVVSTIEFISNLCGINFGDKQKDFLDYCDWKMWGDTPEFVSSVILSQEEKAEWRVNFGLIEMYYAESLIEIHHNKKLNHNDLLARAIRQHIIELNPKFTEPTECECCFLEPPHPEQYNYPE